MPIYEYRCKNCSRTFEILKSSDARDEREKCPWCGGEDTERLISLFSSNSSACSIIPSFGG